MLGGRGLRGGRVDVNFVIIMFVYNCHKNYHVSLQGLGRRFKELSVV